MTAVNAARASGRRVRRATIGVLTLVVGLSAWCVIVGLSPAADAVTHEHLAALARNLASGLFLIAGVLRLASWRLTGDPHSARKALALMILGTALPAVTMVGPLLHEPTALAQSAPSTRALFLVPVVALLLPDRDWRRQSVTSPVPRGYAALVLAAVAAGLAAVLVARGALSGQQLRMTWQLLGCAAALGWVAVAARMSRGCTRVLPTAGQWPAIAYLLLAACELVRVAAAGGAGTVVGVAPGFQLAAAAVLVVTAAADLLTVHGSDDTRAAGLTRALVDLQCHVADLEQKQQERLHDARSAVVGVIDASELLATPAADIDADLLRSLIVAELQRLYAVLDAGAVEPIGEFDLAEALGPVVRIHQLDGRAVRARLDPLAVVGRPLVTATVLDNMLRNAQVHAPGARVTVHTQLSAGFVAVVVEDDGPGIPAAERRDVLRAGVRGSSATAPGEGLGLSTSAAAMNAQGGTLRLGPRAGGGTQVTFTLRLAACTAGSGSAVTLPPAGILPPADALAS